MERESVLFYRSFYDAAQLMGDDDRLALYDAVMGYCFSGDEGDLSGVVAVAFALIKPQIDANSRKYANGKKGGRPQAKTSGFEDEKPDVENEKTSGFEIEKPLVSECENHPSETEKPNVNVNDNVNDNVNVSVNVNGNVNETVNGSVNENDICCVESESASAPEPAITLPLNDGTEYPILPNQVAEWSELYPAVDVTQQLRSMRGWLLSDPKRRKTRAGIMRFINSWLAKEQNRGPSRSQWEPPPKKLSYDPDKIEHDSLYNVPVITRRSG